MEQPWTIWGVPKRSTHLCKALVAANNYAGIKINVAENFTMMETNKTPEFLERNPFGQIPLLDTPDGPLYESNTLTRYIARKGANNNLYGSSAYETSQIDQWMDVARSLEPFLGGWIYPLFGWAEFDKASIDRYKARALHLLGVINTHLVKSKTNFILGNHVTLADICLFCNLINSAKCVLAPEHRNTLPELFSWFNRCNEEENFKQVFGIIPLCKEEPVTPQTFPV